MKSRRGKVFKCPICGKRFYRKPYDCREIKNRFCSYGCMGKFRARFQKILICKNCGKEFRVSPSIVKWNKIRNHKDTFCSRECKSEHDSNSKIFSGENNPSWKGGISSLYHCLRSSRKWRLWREAVFARDNWTCQKCGIKSGMGKTIELHPHHIKNFVQNSELSFNINNGITFCKKCHMKFHKIYGYRNNNKQQLEKFLNEKNEE